VTAQSVQWPVAPGPFARIRHGPPPWAERAGLPAVLSVSLPVAQQQVLLLIHESRDTINDGDFNWGSTLDVPCNVHYDGSTVVYVDTHSAYQSYKQLDTAKKAKIWDPAR